MSRSKGIKRQLILQRGHSCEKCKNSIWLEQSIALELEHVDGNNKNNDFENLLLLCPNCHAQTNTWRGRNINTRKIVTDEQMTAALACHTSIAGALTSLGLTAKGANYSRAYRLMEKNNIRPKITQNEKRSNCIKCRTEIRYTRKKCDECLKTHHREVALANSPVSRNPGKHALEKDLRELNFNFCAVGRKYGVSDNAIRKWLKKNNGADGEGSHLTIH